MQPLRANGRPIRQPLRQGRGLVYEKLSDPILVTRAKDGDRLALEALCERHAPKVERLARHILRDPDDASDAAQEAMAKLCVRLAQFRGDAQFSTWLHRLVVNTCRDAAERRKTRAHEPLADHLSPARTTTPCVRPACRSCVASCATRLPACRRNRRRSSLLKDALGYSFEEIADAAGMPVGTAKCHAHRGRNRLREHLEDREVA